MSTLFVTSCNEVSAMCSIHIWSGNFDLLRGEAKCKEGHM